MESLFCFIDLAIAFYFIYVVFGIKVDIKLAWVLCFLYSISCAIMPNGLNPTLVIIMTYICLQAKCKNCRNLLISIIANLYVLIIEVIFFLAIDIICGTHNNIDGIWKIAIGILIKLVSIYLLIIYNKIRKR